MAFQNGIYIHSTKKSPLGRGNAKGARRGDKNCAALVITQIKNDARGNTKIFIFFLQGGFLQRSVITGLGHLLFCYSLFFIVISTEGRDFLKISILPATDAE